ncbi:hypothetical protein PSTG_00405 [Puccinia striiformis f. sp. tritici PST-78]|uniref:mRNA-capping enzyme subunit beta n=1 Tax=Puccinia striiformis f. sp. tritici PST-78 TaxID=1165861 RepID=A0A0L0W4T5_9BASI|nr:hypothetical protein PSTG_00405 [Puccinia striiformis f. sp. tritici PST-78]
MPRNPSPSSLASLLNPLPTTDHQQQQQHPLKKILLADKTRSLPTKQNQTTKTTTDSPSPSTSLLFIDQQQSMPTPTDSPVTTIETNLEESIFGIAPFNDFTWTIAQFIWQHSQQYWERGEGHLVEVEAKLGTIRDKRSQQHERMEYPIGTESPILDTRDTKFQSDINHNQHSNLNRLLNQRVHETNSKNYSGAKVDYVHTKEIDEFHDKQIRVSKDWSGKNQNSTPRSIFKEKLAHLDIHCPGKQLDFRISVNIEHPVPLPPDHSIPKHKRIKDRLSYSHQICQIDLTQVKTSDKNNSSSTHEVEVEFKNSIELLRAASIWSKSIESEEGSSSTTNGNHSTETDTKNSGDHLPGSSRKLNHTTNVIDAQEYLVMVDVLLNNVRMLICNC